MDVQRRVHFLSVYAFVSSLVLLTVLSAALRGSQPERFEEIDVQRINIVESDGRVKMVITNQERFPDGVMDGRTFERTEKYPGIVFYNSDGDESGGLTFRTLRLPDGVEANASLNFDQYKQDRTLQLFYGEYQEQRTAGLAIFDPPDVPLSQIMDRGEALQNLPDGPEKNEATEALGPGARGDAEKQSSIEDSSRRPRARSKRPSCSTCRSQEARAPTADGLAWPGTGATNARCGAWFA